MFLSVVIPVHNEEKILEREIHKIIPAINGILGEREYEVLLVENGSTDQTPYITSHLSLEFPKIKVISLPEGDYGRAMKEGILKSRGQYSAIFNIDFWDTGALKKALFLFENEKTDIVVCSKTLKESKDSRPLKRRIITRAFNFVLRLFFGYKGTDTHGIKFFRTASVIPVARKCWTGGGMMDTELLLRAQDAGLKIKEIPVVVVEKGERKSFFGVATHGPGTLRDLFFLFKELRM